MAFHSSSSDVSAIVFIGFDDRFGLVALRVRFLGFSGCGRRTIAGGGRGRILGGAGASRNSVADLMSISSSARSSGKRSSSLMNEFGVLPGKEASDFPDGQLGKAHEGPGATVLDEYRGKISSMESVGEGVKPLGEELKLRGEAVKLLVGEVKRFGEPADIGDDGVAAKGIVAIGCEDIMMG